LAEAQLNNPSWQRRWPRYTGRFESSVKEWTAQALLAFYLILILLSLIAVERFAGVIIRPPWSAWLATAFCFCLLPIFRFAPFSFGYLPGVAFSGVILGYVWLTYTTVSRYDHELARWSAIASLVAFLAPVLYQTMPARRVIRLSLGSMDIALRALMLLGLLVLVLNASYGAAFVPLREAEQLRGSFSRPAVLDYLTHNYIYAVLPFAFTFFWYRQSRYLAVSSLLLIGSFYPVSLNKTVLFALVWLPFVLLVFQNFEAKISAVVYLLGPLLAGLSAYVFFIGSAEDGSIAQTLFGYVNERMFALPSIAMDYYADFFSRHPPTFFCQINVVRLVTGCPYSDQLGIVFAREYGVGNLNASLFATEGIASVGLQFAPIAAFLCGIILSAGNSLSCHLPAPFVASSSSLVLQGLLNVPLSTALLTNGALMLFLLWYLCPGEFDAPPNASEKDSGQKA
jgi:hypothetical protein